MNCAIDGPSGAPGAYGRGGLEYVLAHIPDLCILDIGLPDSTGHALAARIREVAPPAPVLIALTGYSMGRDRNEAADAGFDHFFREAVRPGRTGGRAGVAGPR